MMCSAYRLNKQGDNRQLCRTYFSILNQSVVLHRVLTVSSWPVYRFLRRQVRWSGSSIFLRAFHSLLWSTQAMAPHSSALAWKIPWTEEPGGLQSMGLWRVGQTERLHFHFSLSCIGEGNGNPFQCSCLENPRDGGAWCAAVYGVTQSWTRLKRLSRGSISLFSHICLCLRCYQLSHYQVNWGVRNFNLSYLFQNARGNRQST